MFIMMCTYTAVATCQFLIEGAKVLTRKNGQLKRNGKQRSKGHVPYYVLTSLTFIKH